MILELWMVGVVIAVLLFIRVPVGLAFIGPSLWYALADGRSAGLLPEDRLRRAQQLPAAGGPAVHPRRRPGQPARHRRPALRVLPGRARPGARQPRLRQRRLRGRLLLDERLRAGRRGRAGQDADPADGQGRLPVRLRRRADRVVVAHQPGDAAEHPGRHLRRDRGGLHRRAVRRVGHSRLRHGARALRLHLHLDGPPAGVHLGAVRPAAVRQGLDRRRSGRCSPRSSCSAASCPASSPRPRRPPSPCLSCSSSGSSTAPPRPKVLLQALRETAVITGGIMLILGAAALLGLILTRAHVSRDVAEFLTSVCPTTPGSS